MPMDRRTLLRGTGAAVAAGWIAGAAGARPAPRTGGTTMRRELDLKLALGLGMIEAGGSLVEKLRLAREVGFDGVEMDCPNSFPDAEVAAAVRESGLPVHSVVDSVHWKSTLSHADPAEREKGVRGLAAAIRGAKTYGASGVLLVPCVVGGEVTHEAAWERSVAGIRRVLPLAAELGIPILVENVWNGFCYDPEGPVGQTADRLAAYVDEIASPWVGVYLDLGNHRKYADVDGWVRTLGRRIVKLHVKGYHREKGWTEIDQGDIEWPAVRAALVEIGFTGWATAEVGGGDAARLRQVLAQMRGVFGS
ncbi:MAG: sugar phosphate isomerase/epimerase family protein [Planctomycetota bacterium]